MAKATTSVLRGGATARAALVRQFGTAPLQLQEHVVTHHRLLGRGLTGRQLTEARDIVRAKRLLFTTYFDHLGWKVHKNNPTGFQVTTVDGENILSDRHDYFAKWFGVFDGTNLVSTIRLISRDHRGNLDLTNYLSQQSMLTKDAMKQCERFELMELQRDATSQGYMHIGVHELALSLAVDFAYRRQASIISTPSSFWTYNTLMKCHMKDMDANFDYGDGSVARLCLWEWRDLQKASGRLNELAIEAHTTQHEDYPEKTKHISQIALTDNGNHDFLET